MGKGTLGTRWFRVRYVHPVAELDKMYLSLGARILVNCMILGVCELALNPWVIQKGLYLENDLRSRDQNRIREIRPSGIAGRLAET